jgi:hypothetical protein
MLLAVAHSIEIAGEKYAFSATCETIFQQLASEFCNMVHPAAYGCDAVQEYQ